MKIILLAFCLVFCLMISGCAHVHTGKICTDFFTCKGATAKDYEYLGIKGYVPECYREYNCGKTIRWWQK